MAKQVRIFSDAQAIQSERASDFDVYSAYGEVLDNSVEADSSIIKLKFNTSLDKSRGKNFLHINSVAFADDGIGMDIETLHNCLVLGYSSRYGSRKGIGRFGVGMTKGAISQCKRIEIYSKQTKSSKWYFTYFDIDDIEITGDAIIPEPKSTEIPKEYIDIVGKDSGTLVVWKKIDKQDKSANDIIDESKIWIGRTFRKFIFDGKKFFIDGQEVKAIDPLYLHPEFSEFPNDPKAIFWGDEQTFDWEINDPDVLKNDKTRKSKIKIRISLLPNEFLAKGGGRTKAGNHPDNKKRCINRNEGISIIRNNREVREPGFDIPYWNPKFKEVDRWWGCEISFDAVLDNWFQVRNVKRGAAPIKELREELENRINPVRTSLVKKVQEYWDSLTEIIIPPKELDLDPNHGKSTKIAVDTFEDTKPKDKFSKDKKPESEIDKFVKSRFGNLPPEKSQLFVEYFRNNLITIIEGPSPSANFFEITHFGNGKSNIAYNTDHIFSKKYFDILNDLNVNSENQSLNHQQILILIDLLLIAYSMAESQFDPESTFKAEDFFEDIMRNWGKFLRDLLKTWAEYEGK
jgi:hypothetical protein